MSVLILCDIFFVTTYIRTDMLTLVGTLVVSRKSGQKSMLYVVLMQLLCKTRHIVIVNTLSCRV